ncbi:MAG: hypothetical protein ACRC92_24095 [Peptostreptococcaceae bacterium]
MTNFDLIRSNANNLAFGSLDDLKGWKNAQEGAIVKCNNNGTGNVTFFKVSASTAPGSVASTGTPGMHLVPVLMADAAKLEGFGKDALIQAYFNESASSTDQAAFGTSEVMFRSNGALKKMTGSQLANIVKMLAGLETVANVDSKITNAFSSRTVTLGGGLTGSANLAEGLNLNLNVGVGLEVAGGKVQFTDANITAAQSADGADTIIIKTNGGFKKVTKAQFLGGLTQALIFRGAWDPTDNSVTGDALNTVLNLADNTAPATEAGDDPRGYSYIATKNATVKIGKDEAEVSHQVQVGDQIIWSTGGWQIIANYNNISTVFGRKGVITAEKGDYDAAKITTKDGSDVQTKLDALATTTGNIKSIQVVKPVTKGAKSITITPGTDGVFGGDCQVVLGGLTLTKTEDYTLTLTEGKVTTVTLVEECPIATKLILRDITK